MSFLEPGKNNAPGQQFGDPGNLFGNNTPGGNGKWDKPLAPAPPDYKALIDEQGKQGRIDQTTPFGSLQYSTDPNTGQISANYSMNPQEQALYGGLQGNQQSLLNSTQGGFHPGNFSNQINNDEQSSFNQAMALMNPQLKMQQDQLNQSMADRGLPIGSEIQGNAQNQFDQYRSGLMNQAAYNSIGMGQQEQAQGFNEGLQGYNTNMASLGSLFNMGNSMPGLNNFFAPQGADVTGAAGLASNAAQQNYANQMQQYGSNMGGLYSLGAAGIGAFL